MTNRQFLSIGATAALAVIHFTVYVYQFLILPLGFCCRTRPGVGLELLPLAFMHHPY